MFRTGHLLSLSLQGAARQGVTSILNLAHIYHRALHYLATLTPHPSTSPIPHPHRSRDPLVEDFVTPDTPCVAHSWTYVCFTYDGRILLIPPPLFATLTIAISHTLQCLVFVKYKFIAGTHRLLCAVYVPAKTLLLRLNNSCLEGRYRQERVGEMHQHFHKYLVGPFLYGTV